MRFLILAKGDIMFTEGLEARAHAAPWDRSVEIAIIKRMPEGRKAYAKSLTMETVGTGVAIQKAFSLEYEAAQKLMDDLWDAGLRPSEGSGSAGSLAATQKHLADLKQIAFHVLKIDKK